MRRTGVTKWYQCTSEQPVRRKLNIHGYVTNIARPSDLVDRVDGAAQALAGPSAPVEGGVYTATLVLIALSFPPLWQILG